MRGLTHGTHRTAEPTVWAFLKDFAKVDLGVYQFSRFSQTFVWGKAKKDAEKAEKEAEKEEKIRRDIEKAEEEAKKAEMEAQEAARLAEEAKKNAEEI